MNLLPPWQCHLLWCLLWNCHWIECFHSWDLQAVKNVKIKTVYYQATEECWQPNIPTSKLEEVSQLYRKTGANSESFSHLDPLENATHCPDFKGKYKLFYFFSPYTILFLSPYTILCLSPYTILFLSPYTILCLSPYTILFLSLYRSE
jgi:hypothetical protein